MIDRREFVGHAGKAVALSAGLGTLARAAEASIGRAKISAVVFDAFPIFDPRSVFRLVDEIFPERGTELRKLWFPKIFSYTWLRTAGGRYKEFPGVIEDAFIFAADSLGLEHTPEIRSRLVNQFSELDAWPDARLAIETLGEQGVRLGFLSNMSEAMLRANAERNGLEGFFEHFLSTDRVRAYKPDPRAYQMGIDAFALRKSKVAFTAFAGWDACGASWFGYPTVWVNRLGLPAERLDAVPDAAGRDLAALTGFIGD